MTSLPTMDGALLNQKKIESCTITFLSPNDVRAQSVTALYESSFLWNDHPLPFGVLDPRMGSTDPRIVCATCGNDKCEHGHPGHTELAVPIYNPLTKEEFVHPALACVCFFCASLLPLPPKKLAAAMQLRHIERLKFILRHHKAGNQNPKKKKTTIFCEKCNQAQPLYSNSGSSIGATWRKDDIDTMDDTHKPFTKRDFNVYSALHILRAISEVDLHMIGFENARPEYGIISALAVPPVWIRPPRGKDGSKSKGQNDMSSIFSAIIKTQKKIKEIMKDMHVQENNEENPFGGDGTIPESIRNLQGDTFFHVYLLTGKIDSRAKVEMKTRASTDRSSAAYRAQNQPVSKSAATSIGGKEGTFRNDSMGKRDNYSARCVIAPDAHQNVDEVGLPEVLYMNQTIPVRVVNSSSVLSDGRTQVFSNLAELSARVLKGPEHRVSGGKEPYLLFLVCGVDYMGKTKLPVQLTWDRSL